MEVADPSIHMLRNGGVDGLSVDAAGIANGRNGGYQIVNIAMLTGGNPILLVGYDMKHVDGKDHFAGGEHPVATPENNLTDYAKNFRTMAGPLREMGVTVLNCTLGSAIDAFPRATLKGALA